MYISAYMLNKRHGGLAGPRAHIWTLLSCVYRSSSGGKMGRIWRKPSEGLSYVCTAKGAHSGSGGRVAKFMVAVSHGNGVILFEQYEKVNGRYFKSLVEREFPRMFNIAAKGGPKLFIQDRDPSQNSCIACAAWRKVDAKLISIKQEVPTLTALKISSISLKEFWKTMP